MRLASSARRWLVTNAAIALVVLALAAVAHFGHHLLDPHCEGSPGPSSGPCASCSVLHGGALAENASGAAPGFRAHALDRALPGPAAPERAVPEDGAPRAPPTA